MTIPEELRAALSTPRARAIYRAARREPWMEAFLRSGHDVYRRLGAAMMLEEIAERVVPERAEEMREALARERRGLKRGRPRGYRKPVEEVRRGCCLVCGLDVSVKADGASRKHKIECTITGSDARSVPASQAQAFSKWCEKEASCREERPYVFLLATPAPKVVERRL